MATHWAHFLYLYSLTTINKVQSVGTGLDTIDV